MKSDKNNKKCKECYERAKKTGALLYCEATGSCKHIKERGES